MSLSKTHLIICSKICVCFQLKPVAESDWCLVLAASDRKNKGRAVKSTDLDSPGCTVHFVLLSEAAGDSHQTTP